MEIFQTIWTALTSENEILISLLGVPFIFIELTISMLLFTTTLNIVSSKKQKILYILSLSIIGLISKFIIQNPYNTIINLFACPILVLLIFKTSILKAVLAEIIPYILFVLIGFVLQIIYPIIFGKSIMLLSSIPIYKIVLSTTIYVFAYLIYKLCQKLNFNISILENMKRKSNIVLLTNLIIGIIAILFQSCVVTIYSEAIPLSIMISSILILLIYFMFNLYSLTRTNRLEATTRNLEEEKLYNKTLTILYDSIRGFKHDFNNIVQAIGGYISTNNMNGLKEYYSDLLEDCQKSNSLSVLNPELINNSAIYSLLTSKYHKADELGIKMNLELFLDLSVLNVKTYQLTRILGILLDNAIEASSKCKEKIINIIIRKDNKINRQLFIIENTYLDKKVNMDKIFEKGYTSKADGNDKNHGLGLWEVRQILKKNANLNLYTTKDNNLFKQQLEIYPN